MKLIIEHDVANNPEVTLLSFGTDFRYVSKQPNPAAWRRQPYERYLEIGVDMSWIKSHVIRVIREVQEVSLANAGTEHETLTWRVSRVETSHYVDDLQSVWPEIESHKREGAHLTVCPLPQLLKRSYGVIDTRYC